MPQYEPIVGWGVDIPGENGARKRFGNMILSRLPVERILRHSLPWPAAPDVPSMPRVAVEAVVHASFGPVRVITMHREYYSSEHRAAQVTRLGEIHAESMTEKKQVDEEGPFRSHPSPASTIVCGDFNLPPSDALHQKILDIGFVDAWQALHPGAPHPHTFRVHEREEGQSP